jgi:hypothetical protein
VIKESNGQLVTCSASDATFSVPATTNDLTDSSSQAARLIQRWTDLLWGGSRQGISSIEPLPVLVYNIPLTYFVGTQDRSHWNTV